MSVHSTCKLNSADEYRINRLVEQDASETEAEYKQRLMEMATGTRDKRLQSQRHEILVVMQKLKTRLGTLDKQRDKSFIEKISNELERMIDDLPGASTPSVEASTVSASMRRRRFF